MAALDRGLEILTRTSLRRGMSGSRAWMTTAVAVIGFRAIRRMARPETEILYRTVVKPGDRFRITARAPK